MASQCGHGQAPFRLEHFLSTTADFYRGEPLELLSGLRGSACPSVRLEWHQALSLTLLEANGIKPGGRDHTAGWESKQSSKALLEGTVDAAFLMGEDASPA